jgi:hypothetical protein
MKMAANSLVSTVNWESFPGRSVSWFCRGNKLELESRKWLIREAVLTGVKGETVCMNIFRWADTSGCLTLSLYSRVEGGTRMNISWVIFCLFVVGPSFQIMPSKGARRVSYSLCEIIINFIQRRVTSSVETTSWINPGIYNCHTNAGKSDSDNGMPLVWNCVSICDW